MRRKRWPVRPVHLLHIFLVVLIGYIYPYTVQPYLITKSGHSAFIAMMVSLVPLATIVASIPVLGIHPTKRQLAGVLGGLACFVLVFYDGVTVRNLTPTDLLMAGCVPVMYAVANVYIKRYLADLPATALTLIALTMSALLIVPFAQATESIKPSPQFPPAVAALLWFGIVGTGVATVFFYSLVQKRGPLYAGMVTYLIPLIALGWGVVNGEPITFIQIAALVGIFLMLALVQTAPPPKGKTAADTEVPIEEPL